MFHPLNWANNHKTTSSITNHKHKHLNTNVQSKKNPDSKLNQDYQSCWLTRAYFDCAQHKLLAQQKSFIKKNPDSKLNQDLPIMLAY